MKKLLLIVILLLSTNVYAGGDLLNKVVLCTKVKLHEDETKRLWLFWGIKFLPQKTFIMLTHDKQKENMGEDQYEKFSGTYSTSYNEIELTLDHKYIDNHSKYIINRTTLSMKKSGYYYELFEKGSCSVQKHIAITNENFEEFFKLKLKEVELKVDERKI